MFNTISTIKRIFTGYKKFDQQRWRRQKLINFQIPPEKEDFLKLSILSRKHSFRAHWKVRLLSSSSSQSEISFVVSFVRARNFSSRVSLYQGSPCLNEYILCPRVWISKWKCFCNFFPPDLSLWRANSEISMLSEEAKKLFSFRFRKGLLPCLALMLLTDYCSTRQAFKKWLSNVVFQCEKEE